MAREAVAAGEGALRTCRAFGLSPIEKSSTSVPSDVAPVPLGFDAWFRAWTTQEERLANWRGLQELAGLS